MDVISPKQIVQGYWSTWNYSRIGGVSSIQIPFSSLPGKRENNLETETPWLQYPWPPGHNWFKASGSRIASSGSRKFLKAAGRNLGYCHICMNWLNNLKSLCKSHHVMFIVSPAGLKYKMCSERFFTGLSRPKHKPCREAASMWTEMSTEVEVKKRLLRFSSYFFRTVEHNQHW